MLPPAHFAIGAAIGATVRPRWLAPPLALASHYLLDSIPHFEQLRVLAGAFDVNARLLMALWYGPWVIAGGAMLGWMIWRAMGSACWGWWVFVCSFGVLGVLPDLICVILPASHPLNLIHEAMHTQSDWGFSLHRWLVCEGEFFDTRQIATSPVAHAGFLAEIGLEIALFWAGWQIVARSGSRIDVSTRQDVCAGQDDGCVE